MSKYTTLGIGGPAEVFYIARTTKELVKAIKLARQLRIPYFILGSGSNILVSDKGISGLTIKNQSTRNWFYCSSKRSASRTAIGRTSRLLLRQSSGFAQRIKSNDLPHVNIFTESGTLLSKLVQLAVENSLTGLEMLAGIPGTLGAAIVGNAGTKEGSIGDVIEKVTVLGEDKNISEVGPDDCNFSYRSSRFKKNNEIILSAVLKLKKGKKTKIEERIKRVLNQRKNQPCGKSAGSIFKNPPLRPRASPGQAGKSAGALIEQAGLKGYNIDNAEISKEHANFIFNKGEAKTSDVLKLISLVKKKVWEKFRIKLEEEIVII